MGGSVLSLGCRLGQLIRPASESISNARVVASYVTILSSIMYIYKPASRNRLHTSFVLPLDGVEGFREHLLSRRV